MALLDDKGLKYLVGKLKDMFAAKSHTHDDRYYTESEIDSKLTGKTDTGHSHDAADLVSGVLPVARGGTGADTALAALRNMTDRGYISNDTDWDTLDEGVWVFAAGKWTTGKNQPEGAYAYGTVIVTNNGYNIAQIYMPHADSQLYFRERFGSGNKFSSWKCVSVVGHTHDDRYYTESEVDGKLSGKANSGHTHTKSEVGLSNVDNTADANKRVYFANIANTAYALEPTNTYGGISKATRPLIDKARANRFAFLPADQIIIEKTTDGGTTWEDAGISDIIKAGLFSELNYGVSFPLIDGKKSVLSGIRITITAMKYDVPTGTAETEKYQYWSSDYVVNAERYCSLDDVYIWISTGGEDMACDIERATGAAPSNWNKLFSSAESDGYLGGWSGPNYIKFPVGGGTFGGGANQVTNYWNYRFTFMMHQWNGSSFNEKYAAQNMNVSAINAYGANCWSEANALMSKDHLYNWDINKNASFPARVKATGFDGAAAKLARDGDMDNPMTFYWKGQDGQPTWLWGGEDGGSMYVYNPSKFNVNSAKTAASADSAKKLDTNAGSATQPVYFANGVPVATTYTLGKSVPSNAVFTDTNTWRGVQNNLTSDSTDQSLSAAQGKVLKELVDGKAAASHTHNYAGAASSGGSANSAVKLDTATAGSATQPVYFTGGKPAVCSYTLGKSVPSNAVFTDTTYDVATASSNGLMSKGDKAKLDAMGDIVTIQKSLKLTTDWMDTGIAGESLSSGTYIIQVSGLTTNSTGFYQEVYSGVMTWFNSMTNSTGVDEIPLHNAGHAENGNEIYLRTARMNAGSDRNGILKLQIAALKAGTAADTITFKFRRMI